MGVFVVDEGFIGDERGVMVFDVGGVELVVDVCGDEDVASGDSGEEA